ncbi:MAG: C39 family peptidase [Acutalibacteraceae bacterium]
MKLEIIYSKKVVAYMCAILTLGTGCGVFTVVHKNKSKSATVQTPTTKVEVATTTTETTTQEVSTEPSTAQPMSTKPPAVPITKKYVPKTTKAIVNVKSTPKVMLNIPYVSQLPSYPTGCEAASITMLLKYYGFNVPLSQVVSAIPREDLYSENGKVYGPSIYEKFVGDPRQTYTDPRPGYGAFSPVVTNAINGIIKNNGGSIRAKNITGTSIYALFDYIDNGHPVIVWATYNMKTPTLVNAWYIKNSNGTDAYFEYPRGTHVMVLVGYDSNKVYIADPYQNGIKEYSHSSFAEKWALLGKQAVVISDKVAQTTTKKETESSSSTTEEVTTKEESESTTKEVTTKEESESTTKEFTTTVSEVSTTEND